MRKKIIKLTCSKWLFPSISTIVFVILVLLRVHGSSIGIYHTILYGPGSNDGDLFYGKPQQIRSDEWLTWTQHVVSQEKNDYPAFNSQRGEDSDVTKNPEVPANYWVSLFRPHNFGFFFLPLEYAFSFKWWFMAYLLLLSCYFFILRVLPKKRFLAAIISLSFTLSPFILWWYQSMLFLPLAYGFILIILGLRILNQESIPKIQNPLVSNIIYVLLLAYISTSILFLFYPPYSIPIFLGVVAFLVGHIINLTRRKEIDTKTILIRLIPFFIAMLIAVIFAVLYYIGHREMITKVTQTVYPGGRRSISGDLPLFALFDGYVMPLLQSGSRASGYFTNQSEASNFILLAPFLLVPGSLIQYLVYKNKNQIDWSFVMIQLLLVLFILRSVAPLNSFLYQILLLDWVPNLRLRSGIGFIGIIQLVLFIRLMHTLSLRGRKLYIFAATFGFMTLLIVAWTGAYLKNQYPEFANDIYILSGLGVLFSVIVVCFLLGKNKLASILLLVLTIGSSFKIMPLYQDLNFLTNSELVKAIQATSSSNDKWATTDNLFILNLPLAAGRSQVDGTQEYPDFELWEQVGGKQYEDVYNRQAKAIFITNQPEMQPIDLKQPNLFTIKFECSKFLKRNVDFVLSTSLIKQPCISLERKIDYPSITFYIYSVNDD